MAETHCARLIELAAPLGDAWRRGPQRKATVILLASCVLLLVWKYYVSPERLALLFPLRPAGDAQSAGANSYFFGSLLLLGLLPAMLVKTGFRESLKDYGLAWGNWRGTLLAILVLVPVFLIVGHVSAWDAALRMKFPLNAQAGASATAFAAHAAAYMAFYAGWEFYFRGFMLFGLRGAMGDANALLVQTLSSSLLHIGSPASETFGAIGGGLLWGLVALRTRSILSGVCQHYALGISLDWTICFR